MYASRIAFMSAVSSQDRTRDNVRVVELERDAGGSLGLSIAGGLDSPLGDTAVMVAEMQPGGPASRSAVLRVSIVYGCPLNKLDVCV